MKIDLIEILYAVSFALDATEIEYYKKRAESNGIDLSSVSYKDHKTKNITMNHSKRIAALAVLTGKAMGLDQVDLYDLSALCILHDNALTEFIQEEIEFRKYNNGLPYNDSAVIMRICKIGAKNVSVLPFRTNNRDIMLYHHEKADGTGPFGRRADRTPVKSQLMHLAECIDCYCDLTDSTEENYREICFYVRSNTHTLFGEEVATAFLNVFKKKTLANFSNANIDKFLRSLTRHYEDSYNQKEIKTLGELFARIVDYKSHYTCIHCVGVADRCAKMAEFYNFPEEKAAKFYLAGALHDIGKLSVSMDILQKPTNLNDDEYELMKMHALYTYDVLSKLKGMKDICNWASHHHEKLNGNGYPFKLSGKQLSHEERLVACCDIYQALTEKRPYKDGFTHEETIRIMREMAEKGEIDYDIVTDMHHVFQHEIPQIEAELNQK
ncbi:MAG: HD domain-containing protein [Eubacterium sp.]|nr:HD domain-containing protein [Eubacterium sp.]